MSFSTFLIMPSFKRVKLVSVVLVCILFIFTTFKSNILLYAQSLSANHSLFFTYKCYLDYTNSQSHGLRSSTNVIIFVATNPSNFDRRSVVRSTWANQSMLHYSFSLPKQLIEKSGQPNNMSGESTVRFVIKFILGASGNVTLDNRLKEENSTYGDIIFGDFAEGYFKLSAKTNFMLQTGATMMSGARTNQNDSSSSVSKYHFLVKADDDTYVDLDVFARIISRTAASNAYGGLCRSDNKPKRQLTSKFYLSLSSYPYEYFPPYCEGPFYYLSHDLVAESANSSRILQGLKNSQGKFLASISRFEDVMVGFYIFFRYISEANSAGFPNSNQTIHRGVVRRELQPIPDKSMFMFVSSDKRGANVFKNFLSSCVSCRKIHRFAGRVIAYHPVSSTSMVNVHGCLSANRREAFDDVFPGRPLI